MIRAARSLPVLVLCLLLSGCAAGSSSGGSRGGGNTITAEELATVSNLSLYEGAQRLRPRWFQPRPGAPLPRVVMNGSNMGDVEILRTMQPTDVRSMRFLDASDATTRYGTGYPGGAIELVSR